MRGTSTRSRTENVPYCKRWQQEHYQEIKILNEYDVIHTFTCMYADVCIYYAITNKGKYINSTKIGQLQHTAMQCNEMSIKTEDFKRVRGVIILKLISIILGN